MPDGSVLVVELERWARHAGAADGTKTQVPRQRRQPERARDRARRRAVRVQQRRLGRPPSSPGMRHPRLGAARAPLRRTHRAHRSATPARWTVLYTECDGQSVDRTRTTSCSTRRRHVVHRSRSPRRDACSISAASTTRSLTARRSARSCSRWSRRTASGSRPTGHGLYVAETHTGRVYAWNITAPGEVEQAASSAGHRWRVAARVPGQPTLRLAGGRRRRQRRRGDARDRRVAR